MHDLIDILRVVSWPVAAVLVAGLIGRAVTRVAFFRKRG